MNLIQAFPVLATRISSELIPLEEELDLANPSWRAALEALTAALMESSGPLGNALPGLRERSDLSLRRNTWLPVGVDDWANRTRNCVVQACNRLGMETWADLMKLSVAEISGWINAGTKTVNDVLRMAIELEARAGLDLFGAGVPVPVAAGSQETRALTSDLVRLASWGAVVIPESSLHELLEAAGSGSAPTEVAEIAHRARRWSDFSALGSLLSPIAVIRNFLESRDERERSILRDRIFAARPDQQSLDELGQRFGVTRERIRQIESRLIAELEQGYSTPEFDSVRWAVSGFIDRVGTLAPANDPRVTNVLTSLLEAGHTDEEARVLFHLAGQYVQKDGWVQTIDRKAVEEALIASTDQYGVSHLNPEVVLQELGIRPEFHPDVLAACRRVRVQGGKVLNWRGNIVDKAVLQLSLLGRPATPEELLALVGEDRDIRTLKNGLSADKRLMRVDPQRWALTDWGLEEYSGVVDEMVENLRRHGGSRLLAELADELARQFNIAPNSVRNYSTAPIFIVEHETVRFRTILEAKTVAPDVSGASGIVHVGGVVNMLREADHDVLRGSGCFIGIGVAAALGVQPGGERVYRGNGFTARVKWSPTNPQPNLGSLRDAAGMLGLSQGQRFRLDFDAASSTVTAHVVDEMIVASGSSLAAVRELTGLDRGSMEEVAADLASCLECEPGEVVTALRRRGDNELADAMLAN